ncbi:hypothetical protein Cgig2_006739 [Carnegiea gigantea]|uniref:Uncharacterized protein n=1 Tax=Carnegiea gigantea TaxID=171969 RepID=A0A9Q1GX48_9CARY|nr:hypothetical protein Cgig2_006739 [Carnegiea gigantea]
MGIHYVASTSRIQVYIISLILCRNYRVVMLTTKLAEEMKYNQDKRPWKDEERVERFYTTHRNILIDIKGSSMLRRPKPIETPVKFRNTNNYYEYHDDYGHTISDCRELKKFELDDGNVAKLYGDQKMARECYYVSLKSLGRKEEPPTGEISQPNKMGRNVAAETIVVLSALAEEHGLPHPKPTS